MPLSKRHAIKLIADFEHAVRDHVGAMHRPSEEREGAQRRLDFENTRLLTALTKDGAMPGRKKTTGIFETREQLVEKVLDCFAIGMNFHAIAKRTGVSTATVSKLIYHPETR